MKNDEMLLKILEKQDIILDRLGGVEGRLTGVEGKLTGVEGRLTGVEGKLTGVEGRLTGVEGKLTGVEEKLTDFIQKTGENFFEAKEEREFIYRELKAKAEKIDGLEQNFINMQPQLNRMENTLKEYAVPRIEGKVEAVKDVIQMHTDQIDCLNRKVGLA